MSGISPTPPFFVSKTTCSSFLKGGRHCQTCSSLAGGERRQTLFLTLPAWHQFALGTTLNISGVFFFFFLPRFEKRRSCVHQVPIAMKWGWVFLGVFLSLGTLSWGEKGLEIPEYDGKDRVHDLTAKNYKSIMKKYDVMVIYYHKNVDGNRSAMKQFQIEELALEVGLRQSMTVDGSVAHVGEGSRWEEGKEGKGFTWRVWLQLGDSWTQSWLSHFRVKWAWDCWQVRRKAVDHVEGFVDPSGVASCKVWLDGCSPVG